MHPRSEGPRRSAPCRRVSKTSGKLGFSATLARRARLAGRGGCLEIVVPCEGRKCQIPYETMLKAAYSKFHRRSHGASAFGLSFNTVARVKLLVVACHDRVDNEFLTNLHASFLREAPLVWAAGMSADSTLQKANLTMLGFESVPHLTRSSWHVLVSLYRASWVACCEGG